MSILKPRILINPNLTTNQIDTHNAGWYQIDTVSSNVALRVNYSNIGLGGEIRLNTTTMPPVFQGNNGSAWVDFNALQGPTGPNGMDFTNAVNFNNLGSNTAVGTQVPLASIFATTYANVALSLSNVNIRSLQGAPYIVNSNLSINSMLLNQNSNIIALQPQPLPYNWNFSGSNNTVNYLKNTSSDSQYFGWGETSTWIVKQGFSVVKGQAVRLDKDTATSNIVIVPFTYTTLTGITPFTTPFNMLGIATQSAGSGSSCVVCTKGITTVLCTTSITTDFTQTTSVPSVGVDGIVGKDGGIFCNTFSTPLVNYTKAGYFLESGTNTATNGSYVLFYVNPSVVITG